MPPRTHSRRSAKPKLRRVYGSNGVFYTFPEGEGEGKPIQIKVDFSQVAEPTSYYYADAVYVSMDTDNGMAVISFGRRDTDTGKFVDRIEIIMPVRSLLGAFWASITQARVEETVDKILAATGAVTKVRPIPAPPSEFAPSFFANTIFLSAGDGESSLDFYHVPPRAIHLAKERRKNIQLVPVIRVLASTVLTKHFFDILRNYLNNAIQPPNQEGGRRAAH
ncbi:MAG TPA: hypothetical protein VNZ56_17185 [Verrucomicrobiae bacterium]|nr:hypothetical protein [Verrucomicrobiae bacterium]